MEFLPSIPGLASNDKTGTKSAEFTKLFGGVRPASLGGAFIAISDDTNAIYYNPAGLTQLDLSEFSSSYASYLAGTSYATISQVMPHAQSTLGFSIGYLNIGGIEETTRGNPTGTGKIINPFAYEALTSFAQRLTPNLSIGANIKLIGEKTEDDSSLGYGVDAGVLYKLSDLYTLGISGKNITGAFAGNPLSNNYGLGISYKKNYKSHQLLFDVDVNVPNDNKSFVNLGGGYNYKNRLFFRAGFNTRSEENAGGNWGVGIGLRFTKLSLDYAYSPYGDLGITHRFTINLNPSGIYIPRLSEIGISPSDIRIELGKDIMIKTEGRDERGSYFGIAPILKVEGNIGRIDKKTGLFTATRIGKGRIRAYILDVTIDNIGHKKTITKYANIVVYSSK